MGALTVTGSTPWEMNGPVKWTVQDGQLVLMVTVGDPGRHMITHVRMTPDEAGLIRSALVDGCAALTGQR